MMQSRESLKVLIRIAGVLLIALSLLFVGREIYRNWSAISDWSPSSGDALTLVGLAIVYGAALYLLAEGWHQIVNLFGSEPRYRTYPSFTATQIARYLPGNVAHLLGRAVYLRGGALRDGQLGVATVIELGATLAAAVIALLVFLVILPQGAWESPVLTLLDQAAPMLLALVLSGLVAAYCIGILRPDMSGAAALRGLVPAMAFLVLFMLTLGGIFAAIFAVFAQGFAHLAAVAAIIAWIVGFITPGAPGGIGTREATLVLMFQDVAAPETVLLATVLFRLVTVSGDVVCFVTGWAWRLRTGQS